MSRKRKRASLAGNIIMALLAFAAAGVIAFLLYARYNVLQEEREHKEALEQQMIAEQEAAERAAAEEAARKAAEEEAARKAAEAEAARRADILARIPGIVCWGDSLTAGEYGTKISYPETLEELLKENEYITTTVVNMGVYHEDTKTIMARAGALEVLLTAPVVIPADCTEVQVTFLASDGSALPLLHNGDGGFSRVSIDGIEGTLSLKQLSETAPVGGYWFTRNTPGEEKTVPAGTRIVNEGSYKYVDYVPVIFMGTNGGWNNDPQQLIAQQQAILDSCGINRENFVIIGMHADVAGLDFRAFDEVLSTHWGSHYIALRRSLYDVELLEKHGIALSDEDKANLAIGGVPLSLLAEDGLHFSPAGYELLGELVYEKLVELEYIEK